MKNKLAMFVMGIILCGCVVAPATTTVEMDNPNVPGSAIHSTDNKLPRKNRDGSWTFLIIGEVELKLMPFTVSRTTRGGSDPETEETAALDALIVQHESAYSSNPNDYDTCMALASLYLNRKDADMAIKYSNQALAIRKNDTDALYTRGLAYYEKNDKASRARALNDLEAVLKTNKYDTKSLYYVIGLIHYKDDNNDKAIDAFEKIKAVDPNFADVNEILEALYKSKK